MKAYKEMMIRTVEANLKKKKKVYQSNLVASEENYVSMETSFWSG